MNDRAKDLIPYNEQGQYFEIFGVKYAVDLFRNLGLGPVGTTFKIVAREDGALTLETVARLEPCPAVIRDDLPQIKNSLEECKDRHGDSK